MLEQRAPAVAPGTSQLAHAQVLRVFSERVQRQFLAALKLLKAEDALVLHTPRVTQMIFAFRLRGERHFAVLAHFHNVQTAHIFDMV